MQDMSHLHYLINVKIQELEYKLWAAMTIGVMCHETSCSHTVATYRVIHDGRRIKVVRL